MSKGSNITRKSGANARSASVGSTNIIAQLADNIRNNHGEIDYRKLGWDVWDNLSEQQINDVLQEAEFTGATSDDIQEGTLYMPVNEKTMFEGLEEALVNESWGNHNEDSIWTVGYKDGRKNILMMFQTILT